MTPKEELLQFIDAHGGDPRVWAALADMAKRIDAGESIAANYGVSLEDSKNDRS